jgi:iron complex transport system substrate-binding protein
MLLSANPDFVIASSTVAKNVEILDTLEALGITVAYFDVKNFDDYLDMLDVCTRITGRRDLYEQNGLALKSQIETIKSSFTQNVPENERKVLLIRTAASNVKAKGSTGTVLGEMLSDIGCINIADSDTGLLESLSIEAIIRENPYHIFVVTMGSDTEAALASFYNMIDENRAWQGLDAVASGRVHVMDKSLYNLKPNSRFAEAYVKLYEIFSEK